MVHSYKAAFVVFRNFKNSDFDREHSFILIVIYCGCFGFSLAIFGVHFVYRYGAVVKEFRDKWLGGKKIYILFFMPIFYGTWWSVLCYLYFHFDDSTDDYMRYNCSPGLCSSTGKGGGGVFWVNKASSSFSEHFQKNDI